MDLWFQGLLSTFLKDSFIYVQILIIFLKKTQTNVEYSLVCTMYTNKCNLKKSTGKQIYLKQTVFISSLF